MSLSIDRSKLDRNTELVLIKDLEVIPQKKFVKGKKNTSDGAGVTCYLIVNKSFMGEYVNVPFHYGQGIFNRNNDYLHYLNKDISFTENKTLRPLQKDAISQVIEGLNKYRSTILHLRPGSGKTLISNYMACAIKMIACVLIYNSKLVQQWYNAIKSDVVNSIVMIAGGGENLDANYIICPYTKWNSLDQSIRSRVGLLIVDECHEFCNKSGIECILSFTPKFLIGCSATPSRSLDKMDKILELTFGPHKVKVAEIIPVKILTINTGFTATRNFVGYNLQWHDLNKSLIYNEERNIYIVFICTILVKMGGKIMAITNEVQHAQLMSNAINEAGEISSDWLTGNKRSYKDSDVLVGNIQSCGTGFDEAAYLGRKPDKEINIILLMSTQANVEDFEQTIGRGLRSKDPMVIHLKDLDSTIEKHFKLAMKFYKENTNYECTFAECNWSTFEDVVKRLYFEADV